MKTRKMVFVAILTSLALVISLFEHYFPVSVGIPGAKLGLSNLVILTAIAAFGPKEGFTIAILKSFLLMLLTGAVTSFFYSLAGAILASLAMSLSLRFLVPPLSLVGVSELGAFAHNLGQVLVAAFVLDNSSIFYYLPIMTLVGAASGLFIGLAAHQVTNHLKNIYRSTSPPSP